jgi:hypothetical protein
MFVCFTAVGIRRLDAEANGDQVWTEFVTHKRTL